MDDPQIAADTIRKVSLYFFSYFFIQLSGYGGSMFPGLNKTINKDKNKKIGLVETLTILMYLCVVLGTALLVSQYSGANSTKIIIATIVLSLMTTFPASLLGDNNIFDTPIGMYLTPALVSAVVLMAVQPTSSA